MTLVCLLVTGTQLINYIYFNGRLLLLMALTATDQITNGVAKGLLKAYNCPVWKNDNKQFYLWTSGPTPTFSQADSHKILS